MSKFSLAMEPLWVYPEVDQALVDQVIADFHIHPVVARVLVTRGFYTPDEVNRFLYSKLPDLYNPSLFTDMDKAVRRVTEALDKQEPILICGDNDVDGMSGTALLVEFLELFHANVLFFMPNRNTATQSLLLDALQLALQKGCKLMITVDCGITAAAEVQEVARHGIDVIITDHHEPTAKIPHCLATLNPKLTSSTYPYMELTGVGVAFKLAHALTNYWVNEGRVDPTQVDLKHTLDLVALGTVADMAPLVDENRILVRYGLEQIRKGSRVGLVKLAEVCDVDISALTPADIASKVAPRLNSLGRIADPCKGVELLLVKDPAAAAQLALDLDLNNIQRQKIEHVMSEDVDQTIKTHPEILQDKAIVMHSDKWHPGIIAIVTARIAKTYNRPTAMISVDHGVGKGSMRTIPEFPLLGVLKENANLLLNFGGHDFAAGFTLPESNIPLFKQRLIAKANETLTERDVISKLRLDAEGAFEHLTFDFMEALALLAPHGNENPSPIFYCEATQAWPPKVVGKQHLKLYLAQGERILEGIAFGAAERQKDLRRKGLKLLVAYTPQINTFQNKVSIQLLIRDLKILG